MPLLVRRSGLQALPRNRLVVEEALNDDNSVISLSQAPDPPYVLKVFGYRGTLGLLVRWSGIGFMHAAEKHTYRAPETSPFYVPDCLKPIEQNIIDPLCRRPDRFLSAALGQL